MDKPAKQHRAPQAGRSADKKKPADKAAEKNSFNPKVTPGCSLLVCAPFLRTDPHSLACLLPLLRRSPRPRVAMPTSKVAERPSETRRGCTSPGSTERRTTPRRLSSSPLSDLLESVPPFPFPLPAVLSARNTGADCFAVLFAFSGRKVDAGQVARQAVHQAQPDRHPRSGHRRLWCAPFASPAVALVLVTHELTSGSPSCVELSPLAVWVSQASTAV